LLKQLELTGVDLPAPRRGPKRGPRYTQGVLLAEGPAEADPLREELRALDLERMTPIDAHRTLGELKAKSRRRPDGRREAE
jgi:hypothetical protein